MARGTPLLLTPSLDEIKRAAKDIDLPEREAIRFFNFYECKGWMVGKNRMVSFKGALENWRMSWEDRGGNRGNGSLAGARNGNQSGMDKLIHQKELERIMDRMKLIANSYSGHQDWRQPDREEYRRLKARREELKRILGVMI